MCRCDDRLAHFIGNLDHLLLVDGHIFQGYVHTQVTTGHHDTVGNLQNVAQVVKAFLVLDLRNDLDPVLAFIDQDLPDCQHILPAAYEGCGYIVHIILGTKPDICLILGRDEGHGQNDTGHIAALVGFQEVGVRHHAENFLAGHDIRDIHAHLAVIHQDIVAGLHVVEQFRAPDLEFFPGTQDVFIHNGDFVALGKVHAAVFKVSQTDFRTLGIQQDADGLLQFLGNIAYHLDAGALFFIASVREVQTGNVHSFIDQLFDHFRIFTGRSDRADDLRFLFHKTSSFLRFPYIKLLFPNPAVQTGLSAAFGSQPACTGPSRWGMPAQRFP